MCHQVKLDLKRHISGKLHVDRVRAKTGTKSLTSIFVQKDSDADLLTRKAELRFTGFLAEHNLPCSQPFEVINTC